MWSHTPNPPALKHRLSFKTKHAFTKHTGKKKKNTVQKANVNRGAGSAACPAEAAAISGSLWAPGASHLESCC